MITLRTLIAILCCNVIFLSGIAQEQQIFQSEKLVKKWETSSDLIVPESVCYDPERNFIFVSNINGKPTDKDENGFISRITPDGEITDIRWVTGLHAPKGMGIYKSKLYVTDIDRVAEIDIESMMITRFYEIPEAKFLNDIAIDKKGAVYISDMMTTRIYRIYEESSMIWLDDIIISNPNGLFFEDKNLLVGCKKIVRIDIRDKTITEWLDNTGSIDGLAGTGDGRYLFSDWQGSVYLVGTDKKIEKILDTSEAKINAADIEYIPSMKMLLVPTFYDNRVIAYELQ